MPENILLNVYSRLRPVSTIVSTRPKSDRQSGSCRWSTKVKVEVVELDGVDNIIATVGVFASQAVAISQSSEIQVIVEGVVQYRNDDLGDV